ncbi:MAG: hypothetical protein Q8L15_01770 [Methylobacter sp.]|nr:hypothetical protein [Methylobacter sp.]
MAEEQEKDNTWLIAGVAIAAVIVLVVLLKQDETKHLASGAVSASNAEVDAKLSSKKTSNKTAQ